MRAPTRESLAWLAGLYEGEGCTTFNGRRLFVVQINMTDLDVLERAQSITGLGKVRGPYQGKGNRKPNWIYAVSKRLDVQTFLMSIRPWLLSRRAARVDFVLAELAKETPENERSRLARERRLAILADHTATGASQWELARRHGVSRSLVQQIVGVRGPSAE